MRFVKIIAGVVLLVGCAAVGLLYYQTSRHAPQLKEWVAAVNEEGTLAVQLRRVESGLFSTLAETAIAVGEGELLLNHRLSSGLTGTTIHSTFALNDPATAALLRELDIQGLSAATLTTQVGVGGFDSVANVPALAVALDDTTALSVAPASVHFRQQGAASQARLELPEICLTEGSTTLRCTHLVADSRQPDKENPLVGEGTLQLERIALTDAAQPLQLEAHGLRLQAQTRMDPSFVSSARYQMDMVQVGTLPLTDIDLQTTLRDLDGAALNRLLTWQQQCATADEDRLPELLSQAVPLLVDILDDRPSLEINNLTLTVDAAALQGSGKATLEDIENLLASGFSDFSRLGSAEGQLRFSSQLVEKLATLFVVLQGLETAEQAPSAEAVAQVRDQLQGFIDQSPFFTKTAEGYQTTVRYRDAQLEVNGKRLL